MSQTITTTLRVRYADCDAQGIIFNGRWFELFDTAMTEFWRETIGGYEHLPRSFNVETVVAETGARFRGAGRFDDEITFAITTPRIGDSSLRVEIDASKDGQLLAEGFIEYVFVDGQTFAPTAIPEMVRNMLPDAPATA
ncbi:MAG: thioesterase family protein [Solirubrobacterales bacterium]